MRMLRRPRTHASSTSAAGRVSVPIVTRSFDRERLLGELADRQGAPVECDGRQHRVHAAAVRQARIDHGARLVDAAAHPRHDAIDRPPQVLLVRELQVGLVEPAATLDEDRVGAVDHDLGDLRVAQERLERAVAQDVVDDLLADARAVARGQRPLRLREHRLDGVEDVLLEDAAPPSARRTPADPTTA